MDFNGDLNLSSLQTAPVFPELYEPLWWYSGSSVASGQSSAIDGIGKGTNSGLYALGGGASQLNLITINSKWSASTQYALEASIQSSSASYTAYAQLYDTTSSSLVTGTQITTTSTTMTVVRSGKFTLIPGHTYAVAVWSTSGGTMNLTDASLIVFPSSPLTSPSVSAISLANPSGNTLKESYYPLFVYSSAYESTSVTSSGSNFLQKGMSGGWATSDTVSAAKLYTLTSSWSSSQKFVLEASFMSNNASYTAYIGLWDTNTHTLVASSQLSTTATTMTLFRSSQFTLTPGHSYAVTCWISNASGLAQITKAHLVAIQ